MNDEERELLDKTLELCEENNRILRKMRRNINWAYFFKITYWVIIVGSLLGAYYYLQPVFDSFGQSWDTMKEGVDKIKDAGSGIDLDKFSSGITDLVNKVGGSLE